MRVVLGLVIAMFGAAFQSPAPGEADEILAQLSKTRIDKKQIYHVRETTIRRDALTVALNRGVIAFLEPVRGKVTGAVFIGSGEIVAIPPDSIERQQIYRFTSTPLLNEPFQTAVFRFTDNTYEEIRKEISQRAQEEVSPEDAAQFDSWDASLAGRSSGLNMRLLADLLEPAGKPFFLAELNGEKTGWFDVIFDTRATEEVSVFQIRDVGTTAVADVWASFNQRNEARNPEAVAHENKSPIDVLSYEIDGTNVAGTNIEAKVAMRVRARMEGPRVLTFDLSPALRVASVQTDMDESLPYYQFPNLNGVTVVLPRSLKPSQELTLRFTYAGDLTGRGSWYPSQRQQTIPSFKSTLTLPSDSASLTFEYSGHKLVTASYHDQWLFEGLSRYVALMSSEAADSGAQLRKVLSEAREDVKVFDSAGPISIGQRLAATISPNAYRAVYGKGLWVIHMLRMMLRQDGPSPDAKFLALLKELGEMYDGRAVSTWDFKRLAEKHAEKELDWFFDQWVFATGIPTYSAEYKIETTENGFTIEGTISQSGVPDGFVMPLPVYADGEFLGRVQTGDSEGQFKFRLSKKPERFLIDPEMTVLTQ